MPKIDLRLLHQTLPPNDYAIVRRITNPQTWVLKSTRPKVHPDDPQSNLAAYVWRMAAFYISANPDHHRMPMSAFFFLPDHADKELVQRLDKLVDKITATVPKTQWHGLMAWRGLYGTGSNDDIKLRVKERLGRAPKKPAVNSEEVPLEEPTEEEEEDGFPYEDEGWVNPWEGRF